MAETTLYSRWSAMKSRCNNPSFKQYADYGGRGITYAPEWESFESFADLALTNGYSTNLELDRIDPDGNYTPHNCRWITHAANMQNMRRTTRIVVRGEELSLKEATTKYGINKTTLRSRLQRGMPPDEAVSAPLDCWGRHSA
jgi:hypothetical protein